MIQKTILILSCLFLIAFIGCSEESDDNPANSNDEGKPPSEMTGSWIFQQVMIDSVPVAPATVMDWHPDAVQARLHIYENSAYVYEEVNISGGQLWAESGFVYVEGNEIDVNAQTDNEGNSINETTFLTYTLIADTLMLHEIDEGALIDYRLYRSD